MKKILLISATILSPLMGLAQDNILPKLEKSIYALKMSPNGKWFGSMAGDASIYDLESGKNVYYDGCFLGVGNAVADNGMAVGDSNDIAVIMYNQETIYPESIIDKYWFCDINGITPDGTRITGVINNLIRDGVSYVPFIAEVDADGNVSEPVILPYPKEDFFGAAPQFCTGVWISEDGKTVVGQVQDWRGMYSYPIYYKEDSSGNWTYGEPSKSLFNPTGIELPRNPWLGEPQFPEPENFMSGLLKDAYLEAFELYSEGAGPYPVPEEYMSQAEYNKYAEAVDNYNKWFYSQEEYFKDYIKIYAEVLQTSPSFSSNDMALHPSGDYFMIHGGVRDKDDNLIGKIYKFSTVSDEISELEAPGGEYYPYQILPDNTLIITKGIQSVPSSYILLPGSDKFLSMQEYFAQSHPEISEWLDETVPGGTGVVCMSNDRSVVSGALVPDQLADYDYEFSDFYYSTYFIQLEPAGGVESLLSASDNGVYKVYNLNGVKVLETKDASEINSLQKGIYIVNGKKVAL